MTTPDFKVADLSLAEFGRMHVHRGELPHPELERF